MKLLSFETPDIKKYIYLEHRGDSLVLSVHCPVNIAKFYFLFFSVLINAAETIHMYILARQIYVRFQLMRTECFTKSRVIRGWNLLSLLFPT